MKENQGGAQFPKSISTSIENLSKHLINQYKLSCF
jgi:hypothetical protein